MRIVYVARVPHHGFRVVEALPKRRRPATGKVQVLVAAADDHGHAKQEPFHEREIDATFFRVFAEAEPTAEGVLHVAEKWGWLDVRVPLEPEPGADPEATRVGELVSEWQRVISEMAQLTALYDLCQAGDTARLARHIRWQTDAQQRSRVVFHSHAPAKAEEAQKPSQLGHLVVEREIAGPSSHPALVNELDRDDLTQTALTYIRQRLEIRLQRPARVAARIVWNSKKRRHLWELHVTGLQAALWHQLADAVVKDRSYDRCRVCRKWYEVSPEVSRSHRIFCSHACSMQAYRQRQKLARQLYDQHKTIEEIATELGSEPETVRKWIAGA